MNLRTLRENAGLRTEQVAVNLGVANGTVRNWEKGKNEPSLKARQMKNLLELYNCNLDQLIEAIDNSLKTSQS